MTESISITARPTSRTIGEKINAINILNPESLVGCIEAKSANISITIAITNVMKLVNSNAAVLTFLRIAATIASNIRYFAVIITKVINTSKVSTSRPSDT